MNPNNRALETFMNPDNRALETIKNHEQVLLFGIIYMALKSKVFCTHLEMSAVSTWPMKVITHFIRNIINHI